MQQRMNLRPKLTDQRKSRTFSQVQYLPAGYCNRTATNTQQVEAGGMWA